MPATVTEKAKLIGGILGSVRVLLEMSLPETGRARMLRGVCGPPSFAAAYEQRTAHQLFAAAGEECPC